MSSGLQWLLVGPMVLVALLFAFWRLITLRMRVRWMARLLRVLPERAEGPWMHWRAALARRIAQHSAADGCAACSRH